MARTLDHQYPESNVRALPVPSRPPGPPSTPPPSPPPPSPSPSPSPTADNPHRTTVESDCDYHADYYSDSDNDSDVVVLDSQPADWPMGRVAQRSMSRRTIVATRSMTRLYLRSAAPSPEPSPEPMQIVSPTPEPEPMETEMIVISNPPSPSQEPDMMVISALPSPWPDLMEMEPASPPNPYLQPQEQAEEEEQLQWRRESSPPGPHGPPSQKRQQREPSPPLLTPMDISTPSPPLTPRPPRLSLIYDPVHQNPQPAPRTRSLPLHAIQIVPQSCLTSLPTPKLSSWPRGRDKSKVSTMAHFVAPPAIPAVDKVKPESAHMRGWTTADWITEQARGKVDLGGYRVCSGVSVVAK
ncbi:uncharacterized protein F4822DRAFT_442757 [Hypoxylon trugodes]|uniref:uncharacterized protein n=1 Tax=Hypoxylon trugodes TaxID=326681 RepID=UPI002193723A|nr:uncharacterized protein F4822DRAFT_442757 [Hypoxylon trugodes]KAI1389468.1 hypothetical protein F4822DRAFT_442757 [Hypoxylon trugodes]